ncbi:site-specific integrase [Paenibacillus sedimenti]|uniref:Site-specific integrase n=1 Tax=Paenibacillus sedimenti TaxID=2770274 RepID=A0A926KLZ3_9BACL|nr:site-specific integrase [Paenibacillus sedimenti]MBD0379578.1 site-specific integrase [Paenibacillus sedimenti]
MNIVQPIRDKNKIEEIKDRLRHQSLRDEFLFTLGINSGLRISDLLPLRVCDVRAKTHIMIKEKKTGKEKRFKINSNLRTIIDDYIRRMDDVEYLFPSNKTGIPIRREQAYRILNNVAREVGLEDIGCHTMRKSFGFWFYQKTKDIALLQELFNHSAPCVTLRYIGINQDIMDKAIDDFSL